MKKFRVVRIISEYEVVITGGAKHGILVGDKFEILIPGKPIIDPDTNEGLGNLNYVKGRLRVKEVEDKFSICTNADSTSPAMLSMSMALRTLSAVVGEPTKLNVDPLQITGDFDDYDPVIHIGDWAYWVEDDSSEDETESESEEDE